MFEKINELLKWNLLINGISYLNQLNINYKKRIKKSRLMRNKSHWLEQYYDYFYFCSN